MAQCNFIIQNFNDFLNWILETHIESSVCFLENYALKFLCFETFSLFKMIQYSTWSTE